MITEKKESVMMGNRLTKEEWIKRKKKRRMKKLVVLFLFPVIFCVTLLIYDQYMNGGIQWENPFVKKPVVLEALVDLPKIKEMYLTPNEYSRPQDPLKEVKGIVVHYTANPGTSAKANRGYFEGLKDKKTTYASSHYIIGLKGEIIQCIPLNEISYASNDRNIDTISIEVCHEDSTGKFNEITYQSLINVLAELCEEYDLEKDDILRHYDVSGKACPLYFVENEGEWDKLKEDVMNYE